VLGGRPLSLILSEVRQPSNYVAVWRMAQRYPNFRENLGRYFLARGEYPYDCEVRTPQGVIGVPLESHHDMLTLNEIFCRQDYAVGREVRTVVDIGSNIGVSALYFLTRNDQGRVWLFEPNPRNVERIRRNLAGYEPRWALEEKAVADFAGTAEFGVEDSGRYGGIGQETGQTISVECVHINDVLANVLDETGTLDVLKLDTEGFELASVTSIDRQHLERIRMIYFEVEGDPGAIHPDLFDKRFRNQTVRLRNRRLA
jgi:FkbM family methyltransferase